MQSIVSNNGFGFCKTSSFRNCNNCVYRIRCMNYVPIYSDNLLQLKKQQIPVLQNEQISSQLLIKETDTLIEENKALKEKIQSLEAKIVSFENKEKAIEINNEQINQNTKSLQVYENQNLDLNQQDIVPLKSKKGIFGTKYVEDKSK